MEYLHFSNHTLGNYFTIEQANDTVSKLRTILRVSYHQDSCTFLVEMYQWCVIMHTFSASFENNNEKVRADVI